MRYGAVACRISGTRFGLIVEALDAPGATALADDLQAALAPIADVQVRHATWRPGMSGDAVAAQATPDRAVPLT